MQQQITRLADDVEHLIQSLPPMDPLEDWFFMELNALKTQAAVENASLDEENSRLRGLQQLHHLMLKHRERLGHTDDESTSTSRLDSYLTAEARLPASVRASTRQLRFSIQPSLLHEANRDNATFDPVSPTAKIVAYLRGLDQSLQFDGDQLLREEGATALEQLGINDLETHVAMAVLFQSRYHSINAAIGMAANSALQIIEFAAGVSPRGYQWAQMSPGTIYIESDLPQLMIRKAKMVRNALMKSLTANRGVLHYCATDVLDLDSMLEALKSIDTDMPFTIVTEGLLLYFTNNELRLFLRNIVALLSRGRNAMWITDLVTQGNLNELCTSHPGVARSVRKVFELTGRSIIADNPFQFEACVQRYLNEFGLRVDRTVLLRDSASRLDLSIATAQSIRERVVGSRKIWSVSVAK
ncbi:MAG: class I SAM-dependent methyltransferase [Aureliella sp.]